jgi:hypothetical protein
MRERRVIPLGCCGWRKSHGTTFAHPQLLEVQRTFNKSSVFGAARRWRADELEQVRAWCDPFEVAS